jgi:hypothetical protein
MQLCLNIDLFEVYYTHVQLSDRIPVALHCHLLFQDVTHAIILLFDEMSSGKTREGSQEKKEKGETLTASGS